MKKSTQSVFLIKKLPAAIMFALFLTSTSVSAAIAEGTSNDPNSIAIGPGSQTDGLFDIAIGDNAFVSGNNGTSIGKNARIISLLLSNTDDSIAIGKDALVRSSGSIAIGPRTQNLAGQAVVIGDGAIAGINAGGGTAIGYLSQSLASRSTAIGAFSFAGEVGSVAIGDGANGTSFNSIAIGNDSDSTAQNAIGIGNGANAGGIGSISIGDSSDANGNGSTAVGRNASAPGAGASAYGENSIASGSESLANGKFARATNRESVAIGPGALSSGDRSVAIGANSNDGGVANVISVGSNTLKRRIVNVSAGTLSTTSFDAVNGTQLNTTNTNVTIAQNTANEAKTIAQEADVKATNAVDTANIADAKATSALNMIAIVDAKADNAIVLAEGAQDSADFAIQRTNQIEDSLRVFGSDLAYADISARPSDGVSETIAGVNVTNELGNRNGLEVGTTVTSLSGGYSDGSQINLTDSGIAFFNKNSGSAVSVTGVANGVNQFDAVNFGQLMVVDQKAETAINTANFAVTETERIEGTLRGNGIDGAVANIGVQYSNGSNETTARVEVVNSLGNTHGLVVGTTQTTLSGGANSTVLTLDDSGATFSDQATGEPVRVKGVADAVDNNDAVNLGQLNNALSNVVGGGVSANEVKRLDSRINGLDRKLDRVARKAFAGASLAMAMQPVIADPNAKVNFSLGTGFYEGESALAGTIAVRAGESIVSAGVGVTSRGDFGFKAAVSWAWNPTR